MASYRYRSQIPCQELVKRGIDAKINEGEADTVIFSKPTALDIPIAKQAREQGCRVIVDFCDDHFNHKEFGVVYPSIAEFANVITCPTQEMQNRILNHLKRGSVVIPDPYEAEEKEPHADGESKLWFGHQRNLNEILPFVKYYGLTVCTGPNDVLDEYIPWTIKNQEKCLSEANVVLIPSSDTYKSPNRLLNTLMSGCFPVVGKNPSHIEFKKFCWVGGIKQGVDWARCFKSDLNGLVKEGQKYVKEHYSPEKVGLCWKDIV